ncbi:MAG: hypothetical protein ACI9QN_002303, partial [Arcticibacterium sp.]
CIAYCGNFFIKMASYVVIKAGLMLSGFNRF